MTIKVLIADDEYLLRAELITLLQAYPAFELVAECDNGQACLAAIERYQPDVVFLDIMMPGLDGLNLAKQLASDTLVVFVTAFDQFALAAFEVAATDYLVKPVSDARFEQTISRLLSLLALEKPQHSTEARLVIDTKPPQLAIPYDEIVWVDAAGDYMCIHTEQETHILHSTMKALLARLGGQKFCRIHRSTLVNKAYITKVYPQSKGDYLLELMDGTQLKLSRTYQTVLADIL